MALYRIIKYPPNSIVGVRCFTKNNKNLEYKRCYQILGISEDSDQENIRRAYLNLVKKYHPDSPEGDLIKFQEIDQAFKTLTAKKSKERWDVEENYETTAEEYDIKHTAPQHRQYLTYEGAGTGTPFQREKEYYKIRAMQAASNVLQHRVAKVIAEEKTLMDKKIPFKHDIKTKYGFDRLVEDLIQESMSKGEFNNLKGSGKPLKLHQDINPYVDFVTHKVNQVLIDNGFTPEWITLQKEIREEIQILRQKLISERVNFGPPPLDPPDESAWNDVVNNLKTFADDINKKIHKFNLVVPILNKQMVLVDLNHESNNVLLNGKYSENGRLDKKVNNYNKTDVDDGIGNLLTIFNDIFKK